MCVFFEHFLQFFIDLLFGCLHKQSISIENVLSSRVVTLHSVVGNGHISPFSRQSLRWGRSLLLSSLNVLTSIPFKMAVEKAMAYTPQSEPLDCFWTSGMTTVSTLSLDCSNDAIVDLVSLCRWG